MRLNSWSLSAILFILKIRIRKIILDPYISCPWCQSFSPQRIIFISNYKRNSWDKFACLYFALHAKCRLFKHITLTSTKYLWQHLNQIENSQKVYRFLCKKEILVKYQSPKFQYFHKILIVVNVKIQKKMFAV